MRESVKDIFDFEVYDKDGLAFTINTAKGNKLDLYTEKIVHGLIIEDALVDTDLMNDILSGKYFERDLRITGKTTFRDLDGKDRNVSLNITNAKLKKFEVPMGYEEISIAKLIFYFETKDAYGFQNAMLKVED